jgi:hypothetical protein
MRTSRFLPLGWIIFASVALTASISRSESTLNRAKALEELKTIEQKNEKATLDLLEKSAKDLGEAGSDKSKAVQVYLESYRNVEFGRTQDGDSRYQQWKTDNKEKITSPDFANAVQAHVQYVALVCREAIGEGQAPRAEEWGKFWENLFASKDVPEVLGYPTGKKEKSGKRAPGAKKGAKSAGEDYDRAVLESPLVRDRQLQGFLESIPAAEISSNSVEEIFNKVVRPKMVQAKNVNLVRLWDQRIASLDAQAEKESKTLGSDDYRALQKPELLWQRADDLEKIGQQETAWARKLEILRNFPYHPRISDWIAELKTSLSSDSPSLPDKGP